MNAAKLAQQRKLTEQLNADEAAMADFESLIATCTDVIVQGYGTETLLAQCKPILVALKRCGIDPVAAVEGAKQSAIIRAMQIKAKEDGR